MFHTNVYGLKSFITVAATALGKSLFAFSGKKSFSFDSWGPDSDFHMPYYGLDNEILLQNFTNENVIYLMNELLGMLKKVFGEDDKINVVHTNLIPDKTSNKGIAEMVRKKLLFSVEDLMSDATMFSYCWPSVKIKLTPLKLSDFRDTIRRLREPDYEGKVVDPFIIEYRKNIALEFLKNFDCSVLDYYSRNMWLIYPKLTKNNLAGICRNPTKTGKEWLKSPKSDIFIDMANRLKQMDWIDPLFLQSRGASYENILMGEL